LWNRLRRASHFHLWASRALRHAASRCYPALASPGWGFGCWPLDLGKSTGPGRTFKRLKVGRWGRKNNRKTMRKSWKNLGNHRRYRNIMEKYKWKWENHVNIWRKSWKKRENCRKYGNPWKHMVTLLEKIGKSRKMMENGELTWPNMVI
jgi:hypothetical protein